MSRVVAVAFRRAQEVVAREAPRVINAQARHGQAQRHRVEALFDFHYRFDRHVLGKGPRHVGRQAQGLAGLLRNPELALEKRLLRLDRLVAFRNDQPAGRLSTQAEFRKDPFLGFGRRDQDTPVSPLPPPGEKGGEKGPTGRFTIAKAADMAGLPARRGRRIYGHQRVVVREDTDALGGQRDLDGTAIARRPTVLHKTQLLEPPQVALHCGDRANVEKKQLLESEGDSLRLMVANFSDQVLMPVRPEKQEVLILERPEGAHPFEHTHVLIFLSLCPTLPALAAIRKRYMYSLMRDILE